MNFSLILPIFAKYIFIFIQFKILLNFLWYIVLEPWIIVKYLFKFPIWGDFSVNLSVTDF